MCCCQKEHPTIEFLFQQVLHNLQAWASQGQNDDCCSDGGDDGDNNTNDIKHCIKARLLLTTKLSKTYHTIKKL